MRTHAEHKKWVEFWLSDQDWNRVLAVWHSALRAEGALPSYPSLFRTVALCDPANPTGRPSQPAWWPRNGFDDLHLKAQMHLDDHPGTTGIVDAHPRFLTGPKKTIQFLWTHREEQEQLVAIFLNALLFPRLHSRHKGRDPVTAQVPSEALSELDGWAARKWLSEGQRTGWHYSCDDVVPEFGRSCGTQIKNMDDVVRQLAKEHVAVLNRWQPVALEYRAEPDARIASRISAVRAAR